jgi:hypothetical protein
MLHQEHYLVNLLWGSKVVSDVNELGYVELSIYVNGELEYLLGCVVCHVFYRHATGRAVNEYGASSLPVEADTQVEFLCNCELFHYVDAVAWESFVSRLLGDKSLTAHLVSDRLHLFSCLDDVYSTLEFGLLKVTEASAASKNLSLNDVLNLTIHFSELLCNQICFLSIEGDASKRDRNLKFMQEFSSLVLVELKTSHGKVFVCDRCSAHGSTLSGSCFIDQS